MTERVTVVCPNCMTSRDVGRSMAYCIRTGRKTGWCYPCAVTVRIAKQRALSLATLEARFWPKVEKAADGCWLWKGSHVLDGYGRITIHGKYRRAHRVMWELVMGEIPSGLLVLHSCDNRPCVNPAHLWLGTPRDNTRDMDSKGRRRRKTHCIRGHALTSDNRGRGGRGGCLACTRIRNTQRVRALTGSK